MFNRDDFNNPQNQTFLQPPPLPPPSTIINMTSTDSNDGITMTNDVQVSESMPLEEFTLFPNLAPEIRDMIWEASLHPCFLTICGNFYLTPPQFKISAKHPAILHANQEARTLGLKHYKPYFSSLNGRPSYFNPSKDILHFRFCALVILPYFPSEIMRELMEVQNLACTSCYVDIDDMADHLERLLYFDNLKVYLVGSDKVEVVRKARRATTIWARKKGERKALIKRDTDLNQEMGVQFPAVCFRNDKEIQELLKEPRQWEKVVKTPMLRRPLV
ncbi:hypothetical protein N431DRAFT_474956 [Stipitochalara longipes BDJ]|nr:hypothetical protein N431DRAFT_474956 [Stipitochalara longipes BDJ]